MATLARCEHHRHPINAFEDVGALRRAVAGLTAGRPGLRPGEAELVATELGTNLLRHADPGGYVLYRPTGVGIELVSVDTGPGMAHRNIAGATDGLSAGLAGIRRTATDFDCYSTRNGTIVLARFGRADTSTGGRWRYGAVNVAHGGSGASGDAWAVTADGQLAALLVDGLGHGDEAATAARAAITAFAQQQQAIDAQDVLRRAHEAMHTTRGGVAGVCVIAPENHQLAFAGVGNIAGQVVHNSDRQHLLSRPGTLGTQLAVPRVHVQHCRWPSGATLLMTTDGIRSGWNLSAYPGLLRHDPVVIAAALHRDFTRSTDDAAVLVVQDIP